jgi:hypothetical protein
VRFTVAIAIYIHTPGTILRLSGLFDADDSCESAHDDKQKSHGRLLVARCYECPTSMLYSRPVQMSREGLQRISPSCRSFCASHKKIRERRSNQTNFADTFVRFSTCLITFAVLPSCR